MRSTLVSTCFDTALTLITTYYLPRPRCGGMTLIWQDFPMAAPTPNLLPWLAMLSVGPLPLLSQGALPLWTIATAVLGTGPFRWLARASLRATRWLRTVALNWLALLVNRGLRSSLTRVNVVISRIKSKISPTYSRIPLVSPTSACSLFRFV